MKCEANAHSMRTITEPDRSFGSGMSSTTRDVAFGGSRAAYKSELPCPCSPADLIGLANRRRYFPTGSSTESVWGPPLGVYPAGWNGVRLGCLGDELGCR